MSVVVWPVLVLLALTLGGELSLILANNCISDVDVKENQTKSFEGNISSELILYVKAKSGFQGISINSSSSIGWFSKDNCFPLNKWSQLKTWVRRKNTFLYFGFIISSCKKECKVESDEQLPSFFFEAHGESEWLENNTDCEVQYSIDVTNNVSNCTIIETTTIATTTSETFTTNSSKNEVSKWKVISIPVVLVVLVMVVVVVVVYRRMKSKTSKL